MSHPTPDHAGSSPAGTPDDAVTAARDRLPEDERAAFDRLTHAVLSGPGGARQPLGPLLRAQLPGTTGVRWLHAEGLAPTARVSALTADQWTSLNTAWQAHASAPRSGHRGGGPAGRADSRHGHAPGAQAAPRWF